VFSLPCPTPLTLHSLPADPRDRPVVHQPPDRRDPAREHLGLGVCGHGERRLLAALHARHLRRQLPPDARRTGHAHRLMGKGTLTPPGSSVLHHSHIVPSKYKHANSHLLSRFVFLGDDTYHQSTYVLLALFLIPMDSLPSTTF
jgi:hypothetical protein